MKLTGIVEDVFGGRTIFRGYATLRTLYKLSKEAEYQRKRNDERLPLIKDFLENSPFKFFPELIFALQFDDNDVLTKIKGEQQQGSIKLSNNSVIKKAKFQFQENNGNDPTTKVISIDFIDDEVAKKPLVRLDGNHRLSALEDIYKQESENGSLSTLLNMVVPFSILLQTKGNEAEKYESAFFYLINAKAKSLTTEENLKAIFNNPNFDNIEKQSLLGLEDISCLNDIIEKLKSKECNSFKIINDVFCGEIYTLALELSNLLPSSTSDEIFNALNYINELYENNEISKSLKFAYLALIAYKAKHDDKDTIKLCKWLNTTKINQIDFTDVKHLLKSYEKNFEKTYKVFVAMPYISHERVNDFNKLFKEVLAEISENQPYKLELIPIMRFRGEAQRIDARLIKCIKDCHIFVADLSECNSNVVFEIGLAEGNDKPIILIKSTEDKVKPPFDEKKEINKTEIPFDMDKLQYIPYSATGYYNKIKSIMKNHIPVILKERFGLV